MGNSGQGKSCKPEISTSPVPDQGNIHVYPNWAVNPAMQAYYGPQVSVPPHFNPAVSPAHAPHPYMWVPPQHVIPPFGAPYAAMYAHGGVYAHTSVPLGSQAQGHGIPASPAVSEAMAATSTSMLGTHSMSSGNKGQGLMSKMKEFQGLEMSTRNDNADTGGEVGANQGLSQSMETEGSSDGSSAAGAGGNNNKRMRETSHTNGKFSETGISRNMTTVLDIRNPRINTKASPVTVPQLGPTMPNEAWLQDLQNENELKREKRKQSNRESARRSRLRKQAEAEGLSMQVQSLSAENMTLKSEINILKENSEKLKLENAALMEKLQNNKQGHAKIDDKMLQPMTTANLLARVNSSASMDKNGEEAEKNSSRGKLHQLLDATPITDAMTARG